MLGQQSSFNIKYDDKEYNLKLNIRSIKNIFDLTAENPFSYLSNFLTDKEERDIKIAQIIYCMLDGEVSLIDVIENILDSEENVESIYKAIFMLISLELKSEIEIKEDKQDNDESNEEDESLEYESTDIEQDKIKSFINWYNYIYYTAKVNLHMNEEEFFNATPRELKTLDSLNKDYNKNILLDAYITVIKANNKVDKKDLEEKKIATAKNRIRIKDMFV